MEGKFCTDSREPNKIDANKNNMKINSNQDDKKRKTDYLKYQEKGKTSSMKKIM